MDVFLASRRTISAPTHYVVGNEAGDLDSLACAVAYAYVYRDEAPWVPVVQTRRSDLRLRPENQLILRHLGIDEAHITCLDDVQNLDRTHHVVLVDHNRATGPFVKATIVGVIDHHVDEQLYKDAALRQVYAPSDAGSCASVLTRIVRDHFLPPALCDLLYSAILLDTIQFDANVGKAQAIDYEARDRLAPHSSWATTREASRHFHAMQVAKNDTSHLTTLEKLRRDYKQFSCDGAEQTTWDVGAASTTEPLDVFCATSRFWDDMATFAHEQGVHLLMILTSYEHQGTLHRALLLYAPTSIASAPSLAHDLETMTTHHVALVSLALPSAPRDGYAVAWTQQDVRATRKQFVPAMHEVCARYAA